PRPPLEVVQPELLLHLLVPLLDRPPALPQPDRPQGARPGRQIGQGVLDLPVGLLLDQQPDRGGAGTLPSLPTHPRPHPTPAPPRPGATRPDGSPLAPPRQVTRRSGVRAASSRSRTGRGVPGRNWGLDCGRPPVGPTPARPTGRSQAGGSLNTTA